MKNFQVASAEDSPDAFGDGLSIDGSRSPVALSNT